MKKTIFILIPALLFICGFSSVRIQNEECRQPRFPGGDSALFCFFKKHFNPQIGQDTSCSGLYILTFVVDTNGRTIDHSIIRFPANNTNTLRAGNEILRIARLMPAWSPGFYLDDPGFYENEDLQKAPKSKVKMQVPIRLPQLMSRQCPPDKK